MGKVDGLEVIYAPTYRIDNRGSEDAARLPWKLYANFRHSEFMQVTAVMLYGGSEEFVLRADSREKLVHACEVNEWRDHRCGNGPRSRAVARRGGAAVRDRAGHGARVPAPDRRCVVNRTLRSELVELLRCAADERPDGVGLNGLLELASGPMVDLAFDALNACRGGRRYRVIHGRIDESYRVELLEAAMCVEEGTWP
jgi:hypothetical protein